MDDQTLRGARIYIVDDEVSVISLLNNFLGRIGYREIRGFTDPGAVPLAVDQSPPDLLLLDLNMPGLSGVQLLELLREVRRSDRGFPALVISGMATPENKRRALAAGATDFLAKPFDSAELSMRIRNLLSAHFLGREIREQNALLESKVAERTADLERALQELEQSQGHLVRQERFRAFGEMASGIVHDFNNALMSVVGYSDLLLEDESALNDSATVRCYLEIMRTAGRDAAGVVARLRDFYRPREECDAFEAVDLNKLVEETVALTQPKWKDQALAAGRVIRIDMDLAKLPPIVGHEAPLRDMLTNLVFNATDAMPGGGVITLRTTATESGAQIEIIDTGIGMSEETKVRCLEPFFSTKGERGTGLGLSMAFGILKRHDATLEIESVEGSGSTFRIEFPSKLATFAKPAQDVAPIARCLRVLVVDDDSVTRDVVMKYLGGDGHEVNSAQDAEEADALMGAQNFDLLVTDFGLPGRNGLELARSARGHGPVILMTGFQETMLSDEDAKAGADVILRKPVSQRDLRGAILSLFEAPEKVSA